MTFAGKLLGITAISALFLSACGKDGAAGAAEPMLEPLAPSGWADAAAGFVDRNDAPVGYAVFKNAPGGMLMRIDIKGLPQGWHGIHLHQVGDCSDFAEGFKASGGHVDPDNRDHGLLNPAGSERADMPNIYAGADGRATAEIFNGTVSLFADSGAPGLWPLMDGDGFAVIVHANADDHMTQPIGGAGDRLACAAVTGND